MDQQAKPPTPTEPAAWPQYADLPEGRAAGVFGEADVLGCLNKIGADAVRAAAGLVGDGVVFALSAPMDWPHPALYGREAPEHHPMISESGNRDEWFDRFFPQASSQWDGFLHIADGERGYYNDMPPETLGIGTWGRRGIVGRGVLLDLERWRRNVDRPIDWMARDVLSPQDLVGCAMSQGVEIGDGDIVMVRTGWATGYDRADPSVRIGLGTEPPSPGLEASEEMAALLWDWGIAAIGADNPALEAWPPGEDFLHTRLLPRLGLPIGELWWLDDLADSCAHDGRYDMMFTAAPLVLPDGVGSTANALAIR